MGIIGKSSFLSSMVINGLLSVAKLSMKNGDFVGFTIMVFYGECHGLIRR
jgi:hypothetical protein